MKEFKDNGVKVYMATERLSRSQGRVSVLFNKIDTAAGHAFIYTCGPNSMLKAVQAFAAKHGLLGQVLAKRSWLAAWGRVKAVRLKLKMVIKLFVTTDRHLI